MPPRIIIKCSWKSFMKQTLDRREAQVKLLFLLLLRRQPGGCCCHHPLKEHVQVKLALVQQVGDCHPPKECVVRLQQQLQQRDCLPREILC